MSRGKLIVLEGLDGSGKATQAKLLAKHLTAEGLQVQEITFPDYESDSSALVKMYLAGRFGDKPDDVNAYAASTFYAVDRYASYKTDWGRFLRGGRGGLPTATPPPTRYTSVPSSRRNSGRASCTGCSTMSSIFWVCLRRTRSSTCRWTRR